MLVFRSLSLPTSERMNLHLFASVLFGNSTACQQESEKNNDQRRQMAFEHDDDINHHLIKARKQSRLFFNDDDQTKRRVVDVMQPLVVVYKEEIELQAHPIPANVSSEHTLKLTNGQLSDSHSFECSLQARTCRSDHCI